MELYVQLEQDVGAEGRKHFEEVHNSNRVLMEQLDQLQITVLNEQQEPVKKLPIFEILLFVVVLLALWIVFFS